MIFDTGNSVIDALLALALGLYVILSIAGWLLAAQGVRLLRAACKESGYSWPFRKSFFAGMFIGYGIAAPVAGAAYIRAAMLGTVSLMWRAFTRSLCAAALRRGVMTGEEAYRFYNGMARAVARELELPLSPDSPSPIPPASDGDDEIEDPALEEMGVPDCGNPSCTFHGNLNADLTMDSYSEEFLANEKNLSEFNEATLALVDLPEDASPEQVRAAWITAKRRMTCAIRAYHLASIAGVRQRREAAAARGTLPTS